MNCEHEFDEFDPVDGMPASCDHVWHVNGVIGYDTDSPDIELFCTACHEYALVDHPTHDECETIARAWHMGMALEWQNNGRVQLHRDLETPPAVADLVNALDLFEGDDDVPF